MKKYAGVTVLAIALVSTALAQITLRPGRYEVAAEMQLPGAPAPMTMTTRSRGKRVGECTGTEDEE